MLLKGKHHGYRLRADVSDRDDDCCTSSTFYLLSSIESQQTDACEPRNQVILVYTQFPRIQCESEKTVTFLNKPNCNKTGSAMCGYGPHFVTLYNAAVGGVNAWMFLPRCSYAGAVFLLAYVCLSVGLSVCLANAWIVTKLNKSLPIFLYHMKGQFT